MPDSNPDENKPSIDPYRNYKFRIVWDGRTVAGVSKVGRLTRTTPGIRHRDGGIAVPPQPAGQSDYGPITLERGVTHDLAFENWANKVWDYANSPSGLPPNQQVSLKDFRHDILVEMHNEAGQLVISYLIHNCWVSEYRTLPELDGAGNAVAIESMTLENEGWDRVASTAEPTPPSFLAP